MSENMRLDPERGWIPAVPITTQWIRAERWCSRPSDLLDRLRDWAYSARPITSGATERLVNALESLAPYQQTED